METGWTTLVYIWKITLKKSDLHILLLYWNISISYFSIASDIGNQLYKKFALLGLDSLTGNVQNSLLDEEKVHSGSERGSHQGKKSGTSSKLAVKDYEQTLDTDSILEDLSGHSVR